VNVYVGVVVCLTTFHKILSANILIGIDRLSDSVAISELVRKQPLQCVVN
jgi:hypothetical protein